MSNNIPEDNKLDLRIQKTYRLLCDSLFSLLKKRSIEEVRVKDICDHAMVHRSTFYLHFEDKYHLLAFSLSDRLTEITDQRENGTCPSAKETLPAVFQHVAEYSDVYNQLLLTNEKNLFGSILHEQLAHDFKNKLKKSPKYEMKTDTDLTITSQFYAGAIVSMMKWWLSNQMSIPIEQLAETMGELID